MSSFTDYLLAFLIGGAICTVGQLLMSLTRLTPARILVLFVTAGVVLTALGLYRPVVEIGGAGATVPLTGFGYSLANGAIEGAKNEGILGAVTGGVKATEAGITAAVFFGYLFDPLFCPKKKK
jgi:stage V sporulation protein AE